MTNLKLSPCPNCGTDVKHGQRMPEMIWCPNCAYVQLSSDEETCIANHERLAGVCEWRHLLHDSKRDVVGYLTGCGNQFMVCHEDSKDLKHCTACGKKVEVK